jgi:hypothetical protein
MAFKVILVIIVVLIVLLVILPLVLGMFGIRIFQFGSVGLGGPSGGAEIWRSEDGGEHWIISEISELRGVSFPREIYDIEFSPSDNDVIFMGTRGSGLWKSTTRGVSWKPAVDTSRVLKPRADVYKIALHAKDPRIMYLAVFQDNRGRVLKSTDAGQSFKEIYFVNEERFGVFDVFINPQDSDNVLIVTGKGGLLETGDGGKTWRVKKWFNDALIRLFVNPLNFKEIYVMSSRGVISKSTDGGKTWIELKGNIQTSSSSAVEPDAVSVPPLDVSTLNPFSGIFSRGAKALFTDPNKFSTLYLMTQNAVLRSKNGGVSWERLNLLIPQESFPLNSLAIHPRDSNVIFIGAGSQLYQTRDGGETWTVDIMPTKLSIKGISIHPARPEVMLAILGQ